MKDGFVKAAAATPDIRVADVAYNTGPARMLRSGNTSLDALSS